MWRSRREVKGIGEILEYNKLRLLKISFSSCCGMFCFQFLLLATNLFFCADRSSAELNQWIALFMVELLLHITIAENLRCISYGVKVKNLHIQGYFYNTKKYSGFSDTFFAQLVFLYFTPRQTDRRTPSWRKMREY